MHIFIGCDLFIILLTNALSINIVKKYSNSIQSLLQESLRTRREKLREGFQETDNEFFFARHMDTDNIEDIQTFLDVSINSNCEGLMVKIYDGEEASYEPSKRSRNWLKVKKDYLGTGGVGDSMDLVVVGAFLGKGKRTNVYGSFLLGCYDPNSGDYQTVCKLGTGFSDENLKDFYETLKNYTIPTVPRYYQIGDNPETPDVWFEPKVVWEVKCADLSISPRYMAGVGLVDETRGISLRFPRFIRIRDDKEAEDSTSNEQVCLCFYFLKFMFPRLNNNNDSNNNQSTFLFLFVRL